MIKEYTYYEADTVLDIIKSIDINEYFTNFRVDIKNYNLESIKSLMFNYKNIIWGIDNELIILDNPTIFEREEIVEIIFISPKHSKIWDESIKKIKEDAVEFGWTGLRITILKKQLSKELHDKIINADFLLIGKFRSVNTQEEKLIYELNLEE